jgi:hypothetical protein
MFPGPDVVCKPSSKKRRTPEASSWEMLVRQTMIAQTVKRYFGAVNNWRCGDNAIASYTICQAREKPLEKGVTERGKRVIRPETSVSSGTE